METTLIKVVFAVVSLLSVSIQTEGARVLGVFPMWGSSHHRFTGEVMKTVFQAGHQVTVYSPFPHLYTPTLDQPLDNYTHVRLENITTGGPPITKWMSDAAALPSWKCLDRLHLLKDIMLREFLEEPRLKALIDSKEKYDLIFTESLFLQEYTLIFGYIFKAPVIILSTLSPLSLVKRVFGSPVTPTYMPDICLGFTNKMSFTERAMNTFVTLRGDYVYQVYLSEMENSLKKVFPDLPPLTELFDHIALGFFNNHPTANHPEPLLPNMIPIGGIHIQPAKRLPQDIQRFMDESPAGVILFSLGTYVEDDLLPDSYFDMYVDVFKRLPQRVLWKTRRANIKHLPSNVLVRSWVPQSDVLGHPGCVLFITHGGLHSVHEALHHAVPVVVIPQFGDQYYNGRHLEQSGVGLCLDKTTLSGQAVSAAIATVVGDPSFRSNMRRLSSVFRDRPLTPGQAVVFWTDYVLRHGGASHLRPASRGLPWYSLALLDVLGAALLALGALLVFGHLFTRRILSALSSVAHAVARAKKQQ